jgi:uncharacterized protein (TIGR00369 family)
MDTDDWPALPEDIVDRLNAMRGGFNLTLGLRFVAASYDEVVGELEVGAHLHQPYGLVHGGVYAALIETLASTGAALRAMAAGQHAVGLENATSFLRAARGGRLRGRAVPLAGGRRTQVWEGTVRDAEDRLLASGRVRLLCLDGGAAVAGQTVALAGEAPVGGPGDRQRG